MGKASSLEQLLSLEFLWHPQALSSLCCKRLSPAASGGHGSSFPQGRNDSAHLMASAPSVSIRNTQTRLPVSLKAPTEFWLEATWGTHTKRNPLWKHPSVQCGRAKMAACQFPKAFMFPQGSVSPVCLENVQLEVVVRMREKRTAVLSLSCWSFCSIPFFFLSVL